MVNDESRWPTQQSRPGYPGGYPSGAYQSGIYQTGGYPQAGYPGMAPQARPNPNMRAASADRERGVDVLKAGFAEGRLTQDEYEDRMARAYAARTYGELAALTADLPVGPVTSIPWPMPVAAPANTNSMAIASMILGVAEFFTFGVTSIPAIICGHAARRQIRRTGERGDGLVTAGLVLGYLAIVFWTVAVAAVVVGAAVSQSRNGGFNPPGNGG